jgi:hypothetical protein
MPKHEASDATRHAADRAGRGTVDGSGDGGVADDSAYGPDGAHGAGDQEGGSPFLIIDVKQRQSRQEVRRLRQGEGPLAEQIYDVLEELYAAGHLADEVQPVVFIVREQPEPKKTGSPR